MTLRILNTRRDGKLLVCYHFDNGVSIKKIISRDKYNMEMDRKLNQDERTEERESWRFSDAPT